ncbi:HNH endonuclease signature motif containing protein [Sporomusa aerivorans]|uniref:HNH endonuclease signature motif containing protein n=1 Tax=Sporomusa aerivorans TaxID=204936 RepID=UPI00352A166D
MNKKYTAEQIAYIAANIEGRSYPELTDMFNQQFGLEIKAKAMISLAFRHGLRNERDCRFNTGYEPTQFKKGHVPHNKGKKGNGGWEPTQFTKGHKPWNYRPVGSERTNADGYVEIKIADPRTWKGKHILLWEAAHGPVPKGYVLIFADGNQQNVTLENLLLISRRELAVMNKRGLIANDAELTKAGVVIADIYLKIGERKRK